MQPCNRIYYSNVYSSSSVDATARCGLWLVEKYLSICPYLSPTLSIFSVPTLEDLFPLLLSILPWVFLYVSSLPVLEWRSFWASYPPPFSPGDPASLSFAPFIHFTIFSPLLNSSSSRFVLLFHSPSSYLGPYILLNIFLPKISRACSSFFVITHVSAPYVTAGLINVLYNLILVALDKSLFLKSCKISSIAGQDTSLYFFFCATQYNTPWILSNIAARNLKLAMPLGWKNNRILSLTL